MRFLFSSMLLAVASSMSLAPCAQASMVNPDSTDTLSLKFGAGSFGGLVFDGHRTLDGKNFYKDDSSSRSNKTAPFSGVFSAVSDNNNDGLHAGSSNSPSSGPETFSSSPGVGGGTGNFNATFEGGKGSIDSGGGSNAKGMNPFELAYLNLKADHDDSKGLGRDGFPGLGDGGGGGEKGPVSATPLPPAWTLMLMGLGFFGLVSRLRKNEKVFTVA